MVSPWRPFLPACWAGPLLIYHKLKYQKMSNRSGDQNSVCTGYHAR